VQETRKLGARRERFLCVSTPTGPERGSLCVQIFFTRGQANHNNNNRSHTTMRASGARCNLGRNLRPVLAERYFSIRTDFRRAKSFFPSCHAFYLSFSFVLIGLRASEVVRRWKMFFCRHVRPTLVKEIICWTTGLVLSKINRQYIACLIGAGDLETGYKFMFSVLYRNFQFALHYFTCAL
jgi:hypothetical protein